MTDAALDLDSLCFTARALAQTHPMTDVAGRYRQQRFEEERQRQPVTELADWAGTALLVGYCLRRAEAATVEPTPAPVSISIDDLADRVPGTMDRLRQGDPGDLTLLDASIVIDALDSIISREIEKRHEHLREQLDDDEWAELEHYIAYWVIHGYAVRTIEEQPA